MEFHGGYAEILRTSDNSLTGLGFFFSCVDHIISSGIISIFPHLDN